MAWWTRSSRRLRFSESLIHSLSFSDVSVQAEMLLYSPLPGATHLLSYLIVLKYMKRGSGYGLRVSGRHKYAGDAILNDLWCAASHSRDNWFAGGHGLDNHSAKRFSPRR